MEEREMVKDLLIMILSIMLGYILGQRFADVRCDRCGTICDAMHIRVLEHKDVTMFVCRDCCDGHMMKLLDKED